MRGKSQAKNGSTRLARRDQQGEGSKWEIIFFALFFVTVVFLLGTVARAAEAPPTSGTTDAKVAAHAHVSPSSHGHAKAAPRHTAGGKAHLSSVSTTHRQLMTIPRSDSVPNSSTQPSKQTGSYSSSLSNRLNSRTTFAKPTVGAKGSNFAFTGALTIETARNLDPAADTNINGSYLLTPAVVHLPTKISFSMTALYNAEYTYYRPDGRSGDFEDIKYGLRKTWKNGDDFKSSLIDDFFIGVGGFLPTSNAAKTRGFRGSYGPRLGASKRIKGLTLNYVFGYSRNTFDSEIDSAGNVLAPHTFINVGGVTYNFSDSFSIGARGEYYYIVNYENYTNGAQLAVTSMDYRAAQNLAFSLGIATQRSTVDLVQQTETFKFYEKETTLAFFDIILSI